MGAIAWVPEDDVLLKNAVEAGASLEYLAKGAVEFSQRFTYQELKNRWNAILYDPVISVEASARMAEVERSSFPNQWRPNKLDGVKEFAYSSGKRKAESIRNSYYAMRKRICNEPPLDMMDINLLSSFGDGNPVLNDLGVEDPDFDMRNQLFSVAAPSFCGVQDPSYPYEENVEDCSEFNQSKELPLCNLFEAEGLVNEGSACSEFGDLSFSNFDELPTWQEIPAAGEKDEQTSTQNYLAELSSTLFDLADTEQPFFMDNDALEKSYLDGLSSLLLDSPQSELPIASCLGEDGTIATGEQGTDGMLNAEEAPSPPPMKVLGPEYRNGVICCTLNTEDSEIPSNDDVFLPFRCPSVIASAGARRKSNEPVSSLAKEFSGTPKAEACGGDQKGSCGPPQMNGSSDMGLRYPTGDHGVKFELPKSTIEHAALRNARHNAENIITNNFILGTVNRGSNTSVGPCPDKHEIGLGIPHKNASCSRSELGETPNSGSLSFQQRVGVPKQPIDHDEPWSESEFDVPYFSDVEAMILDMDLTPDEFDISNNPEVQQYQHEESKRTIIRLEQGADAFTQRSLAGRGAFAVLYGRFSKYFIKKPEVLLGRSTDDIKVDIDLGRERNGGKISRKQAILKMDMNGIFHLKNIGQSSIHVNDNKVDPGESINLTSGCLIEVRELAFIFETNHEIVKQFVDSVEQRGISGGPSKR